jgi:hypothetical protein
MITYRNKMIIIKSICKAFTRHTGIPVKIIKRKKILGLEVQTLGVKLDLIPEFKSAITPADALLPLMRHNRPDKHILLTQYVMEGMAEKLRENGVQFMDEAGNAYINRPPVYIYIKGKKNPAPIKVPVIGRAFKQTGLRVLYTLLCNPGLENHPYRTIAEKAGVALGMVNWVMRELRQLGFLLEVGKGRGQEIRLINKEQLLERWITAYAEQLRPKLLLGRYRATGGWWKEAKLNPDHANWGGEVAAAKLTDHLNPQEATIYVDKDKLPDTLIQNKLRADPAGDIELLNRFWQPDAVPPNRDMVHPLLVYADLMLTGNQRNMETARIIYDEHIIKLVREA